MTKKKKRSKKKKKQGNGRSWWVGLLAVCCFGVFTLVATFYFIFLHQPAIAPKVDVAEPEKELGVEFAGRPVTLWPGKKKQRPQRDFASDRRPLVAIVIDDMGYDKVVGQRFLDLDLELSFAFLPKAPHAKKLAEIARQHGRDVLLHLPMEPLDRRFDPGPGALYTSMSGREIKAVLDDDLFALPAIIGVNNHMGSRFTAHKAGMVSVLKVVYEKKLFFLDSMTSADSVAYKTAVKMGIKTGRRQVFLDNEKDRIKIRAQIVHLVELARENGEAIAIGHPFMETYEALGYVREELLNKVRLVGVSRLMH